VKEPFSNYAPSRSSHFHLEGLHAQMKRQTMVVLLMPWYEWLKEQELAPSWQVAMPHSLEEMPQEQLDGSQSHYSDILETYNLMNAVVLVQVREHGPNLGGIYDSYDDGDGENGKEGPAMLHKDQVHRAHLTESGGGRRTG
jgi:hypothetical protein